MAERQHPRQAQKRTFSLEGAQAVWANTIRFSHTVSDAGIEMYVEEKFTR